MFDIRGYTNSLNLYKRVVEGQTTLQTALGNIMLSGMAGVTAAEFTQWYSHNQAISAVAGALTMGSCVRKLETLGAEVHPAATDTQPDLAFAVDTLEDEPAYGQAA